MFARTHAKCPDCHIGPRWVRLRWESQGCSVPATRAEGLIVKAFVTGTSSAIALVALPALTMSAQAADKVATIPTVTTVQSPALSTVELMGEKVDYEAAAANESLATPTRNYKISARFGQAGARWSSGQHTGLDFAAPMGTGIFAAASGKVVSAEPAGAYGNFVEIRHDNGTRTRYAHLNSIGVSKGQRVERGERIGSLGNTGNSSGPHLHFEVLIKGKQVDPMRWLSI